MISLLRSLNHRLIKKVTFTKQKRFEDKCTNDKKYLKVRDHYHYSGKYRRAAYSRCNLRYKIPSEIPVVFRNESAAP